MHAKQLKYDEDYWRSQRRHERYPTRWPASCTQNGRDVWDVMIIDASEGGFGLSDDIPVPENSIVRIDIDQVGGFQCRIAWKNGRRCGMQIVDDKNSLNPDEVIELSEQFCNLCLGA